MRSLHSRGDTIVEVIIAITVVSLVLVGAYVAVNHNTRAIQDTQEHTTALKLAESQLEALQSNGSFDSNNKCFNPSTPTVQVNGAPCTYQPSAGGAAYDITLLAPGNGVNTSTTSYEALVVWSSLQGGNNQVSLYYRPEVGP